MANIATLFRNRKINATRLFSHGAQGNIMCNNVKLIHCCRDRMPIWICILIFPLILWSSPVAQVSTPEIRCNGMDWFQVGSASIDCAQSARFFFHDEKSIIVLPVRDPSELLKIKTFVKEHFYPNFAYSPTEENTKSGYVFNAIALYDNVQSLSPKRSPSENNLIVHVPLSPKTMDNRSGIEKEYRDLITAIISQTKKTPVGGKEKKGGPMELGFRLPPVPARFDSEGTISVEDRGMKSNGMDWFWFGPGLINCAQSARCVWRDEEDIREIAVTNKVDLSRIKLFAVQNFSMKFGSSPIAPKYGDTTHERIMSFYKSAQPPFHDNQSSSEDNLILHIPITSQTKGGNDDIDKEYYELMESITNPAKENSAKKKRWWHIF